MRALVILLLAGTAQAATWTGHLDLTPNPSAFGAASFVDSTKIGGVDKRLWHLDRDGSEEFEVGGWVAYDTSRFLGGLELAQPGGGLDYVLSAIDNFHSLPPSVLSLEPYLAYFKTGVLIGYDPSQIHGFKPAFFGYKISVGFGQ